MRRARTAFQWKDVSAERTVRKDRAGRVVNFIRADHIGRPVFATNAAGVKTWTASYLPFGGVRTNTGTPTTARFPGQWYQSESGLHQNWMRDYDPTTGRYLQADPLGLIDGASVYGYVRGNPGRYVDPRGEELATSTAGLISVAGGCAAADGPFPIGDAVALGILLYAISTTEACACQGDECPTPRDARLRAQKEGSALVAAFKLAGMGTGAGRSGGHGTPSKNAGAALIRKGNAETCKTMRDAYKVVGEQLIQKGKGINHY